VERDRQRSAGVEEEAGRGKVKAEWEEE